MTILLLAETAKGALAPSTAKALTAALEIGGPVHILVAGPGLRAAADQAAKLSGVEKVLYAEDAACDHQLRLARFDRARSQAHRVHARTAQAVDGGAWHFSG